MTTLSTLEILSIYKIQVIKFLESIIELFPGESDLIVMRILFENGTVPIDTSMKKFSSRIVPHPDDSSEKQQQAKKAGEQIRQRNDKFFLTDGVIFEGIGNDKVIRWKQLWQSKILDNHSRECIWSWMDVFLGLAEMYTKNVIRDSKMA